MTSKVVTANRLGDGVVVYLAAGGVWSDRVEAARVARAEEEAAALLAFAEGPEQGVVVVGPYLMEVAAETGAPRPLSNREANRARGPTLRQALGKQAELA